MPLLLALSLPSTERINGLATAIRSSLGAAGVETYLMFIRGSRPRIAALGQGAATSRSCRAWRPSRWPPIRHSRSC